MRSRVQPAGRSAGRLLRARTISSEILNHRLIVKLTRAAKALVKVANRQSLRIDPIFNHCHTCRQLVAVQMSVEEL